MWISQSQFLVYVSVLSAKTIEILSKTERGNSMMIECAQRLPRLQELCDLCCDLSFFFFFFFLYKGYGKFSLRLIGYAIFSPTFNVVTFTSVGLP